MIFGYTHSKMHSKWRRNYSQELFDFSSWIFVSSPLNISNVCLKSSNISILFHLSSIADSMWSIIKKYLTIICRDWKLGVTPTSGSPSWHHLKWGNRNQRWMTDRRWTSEMIIGSSMRELVAKAILYAAESLEVLFVIPLHIRPHVLMLSRKPQAQQPTSHHRVSIGSSMFINVSERPSSLRV